MKNLHSALTSFIVLSAISCTPVSAASPAKGSKVVAPPLISKSVSKVKQQPQVLRLPTQAGKVTKVVTTNLMPQSPSWLAKGDKYISLCVPKRNMVACAPIVATSLMKDIEVGAIAGADGAPALTFKIAPGTRQAPQRIASSINYFLTRTGKQVAHFSRMAVSYAPKPGQSSMRVGASVDVADAGGGGCSYADDGGYDCAGGGYGSGGEGSGGGEGGDPYPGEPAGQCEGNCQYPPGNDNGDTDPCRDANGNPTCPVVEIFGQRPSPEEPETVGCRPVNPWTIECGRMPPVIGGEPQELPSNPTPWFPQSWCDNLHILCSAGQAPSDSGKTLEELLQDCEAQYSTDTTYCSDHSSEMNSRMVEVCYLKADRASLACRERAKRLTGNGAHVVP